MLNSFWNQFARRCQTACLLCRDNCLLSEKLCKGCFDELPRNDTACFCCAEPLRTDDASFLCGACQQRDRPFWRSVVPLLYQFPVADMLQALKYRQVLAYASPLANVLVAAIQHVYAEDTWPDVAIPMPLHLSRLCERGYNQASVIARHVANRLNLPIDQGVVKRIKPTPPLLHLNAKARNHVLAGAFSAKSVRYDHIALIDDIMTSSASVEAVAKKLRRAGAKRVDVWCVARTPA